MPKLFLKTLLVLVFGLFALPASAACTTTPITTGNVGYQSHTRYISMIAKHATLAHALSVSWSIGGVVQATETISFGPGSGVVVKAGTACETLLGEVTPGTGDCAGTTGWTSTGSTDHAWTFKLANGFALDGTQTSRLFVNGVKYLELYNLASQAGNTTTWADTGMTKIRSDSGTTSSLYFDGYNGGVVVTRWEHFGNPCGQL